MYVAPLALRQGNEVNNLWYANSFERIMKDSSHESNKSPQDGEFGFARFESKLGLPLGDGQQLKDAAAAIRQEYLDSARWKRLTCKKVSVFAERNRGTIYVIHIGKAIEFDWTWEGAKAFCTSVPDDGVPVTADHSPDDEVIWSGEIVEVDQQNHCLFVALDDPEAIPIVGPFNVRPFEFLSVLNAIYNGSEFERIRADLPSRLNATEGDVHPTVFRPDDSPQTTVGFSHLQKWWSRSWSVLWGPPGTGKTWTTGQQIARVLRDVDERILVVSTTNRATDAVAFSLGEAAKDNCSDDLTNNRLLRIGKGAAYQAYMDRQLGSMLTGTESEVLSKMDGLAQQLPLVDSWEEKAFTRKQIGELRTSGNDRSHQIIVDLGKRVVVSTAFKAMSFIQSDMVREMIESGEAPFTTIFIDEAGLISRTAVAALSLLAARRVVLIGDSKQLAPISRISRVLPTRQQTWLASSGLSHLDETKDVPTAVHLLTEQRRMHPDVCQAVSSFQYDGVLTTATERAKQASTLSPFLANTSRVIWYVLDQEEGDLAEIRAARGPGNRSWIRSVTPNVLKKIFSDEGIRNAHGLFISPFKAQAQVVGELLAEWDLESWESSTVHSQQGSEADVVIFDSVNAGSHTWSVVEWKRLVNVAISRAREAIIVLASQNEMDEPYLRPLKQHLKALCLVVDQDKVCWKEVSAGATSDFQVHEENAVYRKSSQACLIGDQFAQRKGMKPVLSEEQQRLTQLKLDGKPRLVRGVAGSGKSVVLCNWLAKTAQRFGKKKNAKIWAVYANRSLHKLLCDSIESAWSRLNDECGLFGRAEFPWEIVELLHVKDVLSGILPSVKISMEQFGFDYDRAAEEFLNRQDAQELLPRCSALFIDEAQDMGPSTLRLLLSVVEQSDVTDKNSRAAHIFYDNAQNVYETKTPTWSDFGLDMRGRSAIMRESFRSTRPITELAVNVLARLSDSRWRLDQEELKSMGLLRESRRNDEDWLEVLFSQVEGPKPIFHGFDQREEEMKAIARHLRHLVEVDRISPTDICVLYNGQANRILETQLSPLLMKFGVELSFQKNRSFERKSNTLIATTPHSFKGYESEVVVIPCVDHFVASGGKILANGLYVAMTRARSLLAVYGASEGSEAGRKVGKTIAGCIQTQLAEPFVDREISE